MDKHSITIPDDILYCKKLTAGAKLLYGEIVFICNRDGYCQKKNSYFAKLYDKRRETISGWVKSLQNMHFIQHEIIQQYYRVIFLKDTDKEHIKRVLKSIAKNLKGVSEKPNDITTLYREPRIRGEAPVDDYVIESIEYINEQGQICVEDSIDYES